MFILKRVKVVCFDTLLEVLILKGFTLHQNCAKSGIPLNVFILKRFKLFRMNTCSIPISVGSREASGGRRGSAVGTVRRTEWRASMVRKAPGPPAWSESSIPTGQES